MGKKVIVIGAGVAGLTTALLLCKKNYKVTVVAQHMPGDQTIEYTSPWAGANWMSFAYKDKRLENYDAETYRILKKIVKNEPSAGVVDKECRVLIRKKDLNLEDEILGSLFRKDPWFKSIVSGFELLPQELLPEGIAFGYKFDSFCINTQIYLPWLMSKCLNEGVVFKRRKVEHILDAVKFHQEYNGENGKDIVIFNCTGLFARKLGGVEDLNVYPIRGQTILVRNSLPYMITVSGVDGSPWGHEENGKREELTYLMTRNDGSTIIGGCIVANDWNSGIDFELSERILKRAIKICPELTNGGKNAIDIVRHNVGLRPGRKGGPRLEEEQIKGFRVIHNYGAGGAGYQSSFGMALAAIEKLGEHSRL